MSQSNNDHDKPLKDEVMDELEGLSKVAEDAVREAEEGDEGNDEEKLSTEEQLRAELEKAQAKADENWDTVLRMKADLENQRRRSEKQVSDAHKFAAKKFIEELLPVADSMEMGMAAEGDVEQIREGVALTKKVFDTAMEKFGLEVVEALGEKFNPDLHQAMAMQPSEEYEEGCVSAVMQKGYTLNGRLVRPAMVMVVKGD
ncbi:MAG TPA: nucleotide exchange factor GrpE [Leucothrix sp.]|nr:nucleotide exchange factor GrpE [Leucothrix sp.]HIQ14610.1 nucleotide exchange factor GrpE [Leucothrix sp.]